MELVCPHCGGINRLPPERLGDHPHCGKCGAAVLPSVPIELGADAFARYLARDQLPLLVDFWAPWCGPCKMFAPIFASLAEQYVGRVRFAKVNTEQEQAVAASQQIRSIPTLALFRDGRELDRVSGALSGPQLSAWLARNL